LDQSIPSILNQDLSENCAIEFIIIDNNSSDESCQIIKKYRAQDNRIKLIKNDKNIGIAASLNAGIALAQGKYILRMDADDIALKGRIRKQVDFMESHPSYGICGSAIRIIDENGKKIGTNYYPQDQEEIEFGMIFDTKFAHPSTILRKAVLLEHGLKYNENFLRAQDFELFSRMITFTKSHNLPNVLLAYRTYKVRPSAQETMEFSNMVRKRNLEMLGIAGEASRNLQLMSHLVYKVKDISQSDLLLLIDLCKTLRDRFCQNKNATMRKAFTIFLYRKIYKIIYRGKVVGANGFNAGLQNLKLVNRAFFNDDFTQNFFIVSCLKYSLRKIFL